MMIYVIHFRFTRSFRYDFEDTVSVDNLKKFVLRVVKYVTYALTVALHLIMPALSLSPHLVYSTTVERINTTNQLSALQKDHPVLFLLIHDGEVDDDWGRIYSKAAKENVLRGVFLDSLNPDIIKVGSYIGVMYIVPWTVRKCSPFSYTI